MTLTQAQVIADNVEKTYRELAAAAKPQARSRISHTPNGYIHLVAWSNASLLRVLVVRYTLTLHKSQYRTRIQIDDASRSTVANIEEGFARPTTKEYLNFLGFSQASLIEVKGDIQRLRQDGLLASLPGSSLGSLGIDLGDWHEALKASMISRAPTEPAPSKVLQIPLNSSKGFYRNLEEFTESPSASTVPHNSTILQTPLISYTFLYNPVDNLRPQDLTYEIFIELVNKTDWHLRKLVISLEDKLARDQKFYQVEQARIRGNVSWRR
ncbi:MAG: four helix bundle protein [Candidatus Gottesmanbacteria bacterium]|nr:four helix bundle protein [Candidatus Gottesmanbacteria bacterium]